ncbi:MAG: hypothetical protein HY289_04200 [Planctomycetes bacterium]|nr:hypothetical protein [Planctomycetota bacterium]
MTKKTDAEVVREVTARIDASIAENRRSEHVIIGVLLALFAVGLTLIIWGAVIGRWELLVPGGFAQLTIAFPIRRLIKLREDNVRLQIIPQLLRLAETDKGKALAAVAQSIQL